MPRHGLYSNLGVYRGLGFRGLGFRGLGFRGLGFRGLGFSGLGFRVGVYIGVLLGFYRDKILGYILGTANSLYYHIISIIQLLLRGGQYPRYIGV